MKSPPHNDSESSDLFKKAMKEVQPFSHEEDKHSLKKSTSLEKAYRRHGAVTESVEKEFSVEVPSIFAAEESVCFLSNPLQKKQLQQFKNGKIPPEARLDLHGLTLMKAEKRLASFIESCYLKNLRSLLIIHGKGSRDKEEKPVMKNMTIQFLKEHPQVLALCSAIPSQGGAGALYVLLKKPNTSR